MRAAPVDIGQPAPKPFFYGYWADTAISTANQWTNLPITTVPYKQKGMALISGGCRVPVPGLYQVGALCRTDTGPAAANYSGLAIVVNGNIVDYTLVENGNVGGNLYPYACHQMWGPMVLNAGDVIGVQVYGYPYTVTAVGAGWPGDGLRVMYDSPWTGTP